MTESIISSMLGGLAAVIVGVSCLLLYYKLVK